MAPPDQDKIRQVARLMAEATRVCCTTGAGVSAESGVPTFRDANGLWEGRRPEDVATPEAFAANPEDVWRFYLWRRQVLATRRPNPGHYALAELGRMIEDFALVTQNVDNLHRLAGSDNVIEIHGNVWINRCTRGLDRGCPERIASADDGVDEIPHCASCGAMARPGVVWFGEMLPMEAFAAAERAARRCEVMLVVGTSSIVYPAAGLSRMASQAGAAIIEINLNDTPLTCSADYHLAGRSAEILPQLIESLKRLRDG
jgi:NAD-dependent deacetylase